MLIRNACGASAGKTGNMRWRSARLIGGNGVGASQLGPGEEFYVSMEAVGDSSQ